MSNDYMRQRRKAFVSYETFLESYWAHFSQYVTKGLGTKDLLIEWILCTDIQVNFTDPALVFSEIMGKLRFLLTTSSIEVLTYTIPRCHQGIRASPTGHTRLY